MHRGLGQVQLQAYGVVQGAANHRPPSSASLRVSPPLCQRHDSHPHSQPLLKRTNELEQREAEHRRAEEVLGRER